MTDDIKLEEVGAADKVKLGAAVIAVIAGIAGYYLLGTDATWQRWAAVVAGIVVGALLLAFSRYGREFGEFVGSARVELRKIVWPSKQDAGVTTLVVFAFVAIAGFFFWGLDLLLAWATKALTGQGG
jgi:preprotein translocase subunit SecE